MTTSGACSTSTSATVPSYARRSTSSVSPRPPAAMRRAPTSSTARSVTSSSQGTTRSGSTRRCASSSAGSPDPARRRWRWASGNVSGRPCCDRDETRKELAGIDSASREAVGFGEGIYSEEHTRRTYEELGERARALLEDGSTVIVDATFSRLEQRQRFLELARQTGARLVQFECRVPPEIATERMVIRERHGADAADATPALQESQRAAYTPPADAEVLDATPSPEAVKEDALRHLRRTTA